MTDNGIRSKKITEEEVDKLLEIFRAALHRSGLPSEQVRRIVEIYGEEIAAKMIIKLRDRIEATSDVISRIVRVLDRVRPPNEMLEATGRHVYAKNEILELMPRGEGGLVELVFFKLKVPVADEELDEEFARHWLKPTDPYSLSAFNEADSTFADTHPNLTHWTDVRGRRCYSLFDRCGDDRDVVVNYVDDQPWPAGHWFAGIASDTWRFGSIVMRSSRFDLKVPPIGGAFCLQNFREYSMV